MPTQGAEGRLQILGGCMPGTEPFQEKERRNWAAVHAKAKQGAPAAELEGAAVGRGRESTQSGCVEASTLVLFSPLVTCCCVFRWRTLFSLTAEPGPVGHFCSLMAIDRLVSCVRRG